MVIPKRAAALLFVALVAAVVFAACLSSVGARSEDVDWSMTTSGLHGRRLLLQLTGKPASKGTHASSKVVRAANQVDVDYGPPGRNPPVHQDPPTPFTMRSFEDEPKSLSTWSSKTGRSRLLLLSTEKVESEGRFAFSKVVPAESEGRFAFSKVVPAAHQVDVDYGPPGRNPPVHQDPPSPYTMRSFEDEPKSLSTWSSMTGNANTDYVPAKPDAPNDDHDYPPSGHFGVNQEVPRN